MSRRRPSLKTPCVADRYHGPHERIAEFSWGEEGGLISLRESPNGNGGLILEIYRVTPGVVIRVPNPERG